MAQVWDLEAGTVLHNSSILCAAALTCLALDPSFPRLAVGAADGVVRFFDLSTPAYRQVQVMDVGNAVEKQIAAKLSQQVAAAAGPKGTRVISCAPQWKSPAPPEGDLQAQAVSWGGCAVGSLFYATSLAAHQGAEGWSPMMAQAPCLMVALPGALALVDTHTYNVERLCTFEGQMLGEASHSGAGVLVECCVASAFQAKVCVLTWQSRGSTGSPQGLSQPAGAPEVGSTANQMSALDLSSEPLSVFPTGGAQKGPACAKKAMRSGERGAMTWVASTKISTFTGPAAITVIKQCTHFAAQ
ncbi:hypothetical protein CYMTET_30178 [Cymbomonas tetramitiformis]|uniref:Uncharacterized protein n=1 Tax=Cymbomonas tetramitiformis TaxID=36881 RepID=A0AAE0FJH0_9CHLO|nr:hypothetical protein CYMTET_30178 [Cymbomonas tetramitiformis]